MVDDWGRIRWGACAAVLAMAVACRSTPDATMKARCALAAAARSDSAAGLCLAAYVSSGDGATGARAARALQSRDGALSLLERLASQVGDTEAGADAWLAVGVSRDASGDFPAAVTAYQRAGAHRAKDDQLGRMHDAVGLLLHELNQGNFQSAMQQAVVAYDLVNRVGRPDDRATVNLNVAGLLLALGNLPTSKRLVDETERLVTTTSRTYGYLRKLSGLIQEALHHPVMARTAFRDAHDFAVAHDDRSLELDTRFNLVGAALRAGELDDASKLLDARPLGLEALPNDRAADAYYRGLLEIARQRYRAAVQIVEHVLPDASESWSGLLEGVRGTALRHTGELAAAERALVRSIEAVERKRAALDSDTFKSWLLAEERTPFEELFLLYVTSDRLADAFAIVQRATARSTLDGLLGSERPDTAAAPGFAAAGARIEAVRALARSVRSSPAAATPPVAEVLARLRGNHVITYFRAYGELWAIVISRDGALTARRIGIASELAARAASWRTSPEAVNLADELGALLLPDEVMPPAGAPLFIVADEPVAEVPFAALRRNGEPVVAHHAVAHAPSAAVLSYMRRSRSSRRALIVGDPTNDLPQARAEAVEVARTLNVAPYLGAAATRASVLDANDAALIHIAAHTEPTVSGAALQMSDGPLGAGMVLDRGVSAGAIVLMTCSSAAAGGTDELAALAAAFVAAGAHTVIASRWAVEDDVARRFTRLFYEANGVADPVAAVAAAQRQLASQHVPVSQWSTFVVMGGIP